MKKFGLFLLILVAFCFPLTGCKDDDKEEEKEKKTFVVTFNNENGELIEKVNVKEGDTPSKTYQKVDTNEWDYTFEGWSETQNGSVINLSSINSDKTYYAVISKVKKQYTISFNSNGGSDVNVITKSFGEVVNAPVAPTKTGYTFVKWQLSNNDYTFNTMPAQNIELKAVWQVNQYTISFDPNGGSNVNAITKNFGEVVNAPTAPTKDGYTFVKWQLNNTDYTFNTIPAQNIELKAVWNINQYTITFNSNGGSDVLPITKNFGEVINAPAAPSKGSENFVCWCTDQALTTKAEWPLVITKNMTLYASWNSVVDVKAYLKTLMDSYELNPYSYIPEPLRPTYSNNLVNKESIITDYSSFVNKSNITDVGFGEQWHMVIENLQQSMTFFNILSVVESIATTSVTTFNNYFDQNPADTAHHSFATGIYNVTIDFDGNEIYYVLDYTATIPLLGEQSIQISLSMDIETLEKTVRVQIGDANALKYIITENSYSFYIKYLGIRRAAFTVSRDDNDNVEGHINEFLVIADKEFISAVDFYIEDDYTSVVGNKASGIIGFTGYINELYNTKTGKLLSYEVRETLSSITYNTLWFNLSDINGINSIKYQEATEDEAAVLFINNLTTKWANKKVGGFNLKSQSRRFDLEFRTKYVYSYNATDEVYEEIAISVPMLFVQEENYSTLTADVASVNQNVNLTVTLATNILTKVQEDYDTLVDIFISNKGNVTKAMIEEEIGLRVTFKD